MKVPLQIHHLHIFHNTPCLHPKTLHNLCFYITVVLREIEDNAYAKFEGGGGGGGWRANKSKSATFQCKLSFIAIFFCFMQVREY